MFGFERRKYAGGCVLNSLTKIIINILIALGKVVIFIAVIGIGWLIYLAIVLSETPEVKIVKQEMRTFIESREKFVFAKEILKKDPSVYEKICIFTDRDIDDGGRAVRMFNKYFEDQGITIKEDYMALITLSSVDQLAIFPFKSKRIDSGDDTYSLLFDSPEYAKQLQGCVPYKQAIFKIKKLRLSYRLLLSKAK